MLQISHLMQLVVDGSAGLNDSQVKRPAPVPPTMSKKEAEEWFGLKPSKLPTGEKGTFSQQSRVPSHLAACVCAFLSFEGLLRVSV